MRSESTSRRAEAGLALRTRNTRLSKPVGAQILRRVLRIVGTIVPDRNVGADSHDRAFVFDSRGAQPLPSGAAGVAWIQTDQGGLATGWRSTVGEHVQHDFDELTEAALTYAFRELAKFGDIYAFAVHRLTDDDTLLSLPAPEGGADHPASTSALGQLAREAREDTRTLRAIAIVADMRLEDGSDAIRVQLEHRNGYAIDVLARYSRRRFGRAPRYGPLSASEGTGVVWNRAL
jgi:hypothetical protein